MDGNRQTLAVTLPVAEVVGRSWDWLRPHLDAAWKLSTDLANWSVHRLYTLDVPGGKEPAAVKNWYGYGDAGSNFPGWSGWAGAMASAQCVLRAVHRKYRQVRFDVMVRHAAHLLTYRHPYPFPVHKQNWKAGYADGGFPTVTLPLPGCGAVTLRLKRRADFGRQLARFKQLHDGTAEKGEAALYRDRDGQLLVKLVGQFPRPARGPADNVCFLHTDPNALLVAEINGRSVTVTNADHLKRAFAIITTTAARHRAFLERARQDKKREVRMDRDRRRQLDAAVAERCKKMDRRMGTAVDQIAAQVVRFLERQRVGLVAYDDSVRSFLPDGFRWHDLKDRVKTLFVGDLAGGWVCGEFVSLNEEGRESWLAKARATATAGRRALSNARRKGSHPKVSTCRRTRKSSASARG